MAKVLSFAEKRAAVKKAIEGLTDVQEFLARAQKLEVYMRSCETSSETEIAAAVQAVLDDADALRDDVVSALTILNFQHQIVIKPPRDFVSIFLDAVDTGASNKTSLFTSNFKKTSAGDPFQGSPFACFVAGDKIEIFEAEDAGNKGKQFTVESVTVVANTSEKIVATTAVSGAVDNLDDTTMTLVLKER